MSISPRLAKVLRQLPDTPGVYFFRGRGGEVLYIGKATSLRNRVRSYFSGNIREARGPLVAQMIGRIKNISFKKTDSVLEALVLEAGFIKKHQPRYNSDDKDDKSFNCVVITNEDFPRLLVVRQKDLNVKLYAKPARLNSRSGGRYTLNASFGPFPHATELRDALKIIRKIFPFRDEKCAPHQGRPCFGRQLGLCPGVCTGEVSAKDYRKTIRHLIMFFEGKKTALLRALEREMKAHADKHEFEKAARMKRQIFALRHVQDMALLRRKGSVSPLAPARFRVEAFDIAHVSGKSAVGVMAVILDGNPAKQEYRTFHVTQAKSGSDTDALREILSRRLRHEEWQLPHLIVVDGGIQQLRAAENVVRSVLTPPDFIPVVAVVKDSRHRPRDILGGCKFSSGREREVLLANAEAHRFALSFHRRVRERRFLRRD
jgi:excinuclease UvrABC nuclease subunit